MIIVIMERYVKCCWYTFKRVINSAKDKTGIGQKGERTEIEERVAKKLVLEK